MEKKAALEDIIGTVGEICIDCMFSSIMRREENVLTFRKYQLKYVGGEVPQ